MKFAVINDIQGNLAALEATLEAIDAIQPKVEQVVSGGDVVGRGPHPNEVIDLLRERNISSVRGNYDDAVAVGRRTSGVDFPDEAAQAADDRALEWTRQALTEENREFLRALPENIRLSPSFAGVKVERVHGDEAATEYRRTFILRSLFGGFAARPAKESAKRVLIMHGSPRALNELVRPETALSILRIISRDAKADMLVTGHAGEAFRRDAEDTIFVGAGSLSGTHSVLGRANFTVVDVGQEVNIQFGQVSYDPGGHLDAMRVAGLEQQPSFFRPHSA